MKAHDLWLPEAQNGNPEAQYKLAHLYIGGFYSTNEGLMKDLQEAEKWLLRAAEHGHADAQYDLGIIYAQGPLKDPEKAIKWLTVAAEKGRPEAQYNLGYMYATGAGVGVDFGSAETWIRKSAMQGFPQAQFMLGGMYYEGKGVTQDATEAYAWWTLARDDGYSDAEKLVRKADDQWDDKIIEAGKWRAAEIQAEMMNSQLRSGNGKQQ